jgi:hypothetical protein
MTRELQRVEVSDNKVHCKKRLAVFPSPFTKLSLAGKNLIITGQGEFGK